VVGEGWTEGGGIMESMDHTQGGPCRLHGLVNPCARPFFSFLNRHRDTVDVHNKRGNPIAV
jgi:hypothetical protein